MSMNHSLFILRKVFVALSISLVLSSGAIVRAAGQTTLPLDPKGSSLTFVGKSLLHNFHGEAKEFSGSAALDPQAVPPVQTAHLDFKTTKLTTFIGARDKKMREWMHVDVHSDAIFELRAVRPVSGDWQKAGAAHPAEFKVSGAFTLNGVMQPVSGRAKGWREKDRLIVAGDTVVDTLKFGLPQIRVAFITVETNVATSYRFSFVLPPDYAMK
jgi:polyisoprenoid-binding protein YceI